jgi:hypothetical protein
MRPKSTKPVGTAPPDPQEDVLPTGTSKPAVRTRTQLQRAARGVWGQQEALETQKKKKVEIVKIPAKKNCHPE